MATTPDYKIDYDDQRFEDVKTEETKQLTEWDQTYNGMIGDVDKHYDSLKEATEQWKNTQTDIQNQQTDFTIQQIEQQKEQAQKDYTKEQAGAYVDWRKQSNQYGTEAEKMASAGLTNTGYSESSQVSMYNTYQNRVATARESFQQAWTNYNNKITEAKLQNNAAIAEIALEAFQKQAEYSLEAFQYKNQLVLDLADKKMETKKFYADQWQNVLDQMNKENTLAEEVRQFNENLEFEATQADLERQWKEKENDLDRKFQLQRDDLQRKFDEAQAELDREHDFALIEANTKAEKERADYEHKLAMDKLKQQHAYELEQLDKELANEKALYKYKYDLESQGSGGSGGGSGSGSGGGTFSKISPATVKANKTVKTTKQSILDLGYGPISAARLNQLVAQGVVEEYVDSNGVQLFRKKSTAKSPTYKLNQLR